MQELANSTDTCGDDGDNDNDCVTTLTTKDRLFFLVFLFGLSWRPTSVVLSHTYKCSVTHHSGHCIPTSGITLIMTCSKTMAHSRRQDQPQRLWRGSTCDQRACLSVPQTEGRTSLSQPFQVVLKVVNSLSVPLTGGVFNVEGPGIQRVMGVKLKWV